MLADIEWSDVQGREANEAIREAVDVLEAEPAGEGLVRAYSLNAKLAIVDHQFEQAVAWGERAIKTAEQACLPTPVHAMVTVRRLLSVAMTPMLHVTGGRYNR